MTFCEKCGALLLPQVTDDGVSLACSACNTELSAKDSQGLVIQEKIQHKEDQKPIIIDEEAIDIDTMPTTTELCPKCGHNKASYWQLQTRRADEGMTTFYRCKKCSQTWRHYD